jgi:hypothetical protein
VTSRQIPLVPMACETDLEETLESRTIGGEFSAQPGPTNAAARQAEVKQPFLIGPYSSIVPRKFYSCTPSTKQGACRKLLPLR